MNLAKRMDQFKGYLGTEMNVRLTKMREEGRDVINLGIGDPDVTPPQHLLDTLRDLKEAIAGWYRRRFNVSLDPETEILPLLGSSEGLFHIGR